MPLEEVFEQLRTSRDGLSSADAESRLQLFGLNKLEEKPVSSMLSFFNNSAFFQVNKGEL